MEKELSKDAKNASSANLTAVDFLIEEIKADALVCVKSIDEWNQVFRQAKEMHKQEHSKTWDESMRNLDVRGGNIVRAWDDFDEYYEQLKQD